MSPQNIVKTVIFVALITHPTYVLSADYGRGSIVNDRTLRSSSIEELAALDAIKLRPAELLCATLAIPIEQKFFGLSREGLKNVKLASALVLSRNEEYEKAGYEMVVNCLEANEEDRTVLASYLPRRLKKGVEKWTRENPNVGLTDLEKSMLGQYRDKMAAAGANNKEIEKSILSARDQIANFSRYKSAAALPYVNSFSLAPKLPERGTYETKREYEARIKHLVSVKKDITTRHFYGPVEVRVDSGNEESAFFSVSIGASESEVIDRRRESWEGENAFGARATLHKDISERKQVTIKVPPSPWTDMRAFSTGCYGRHEMVPLDLKYVKQKNSDVKLVRIADFNLLDPETYDFRYSSEEPTFIDRFGYETSTHVVQGDLRAMGLVDANDDNKVLAVFSQDLKTLHRFVPDRSDISLDHYSCTAEYYSWD